MTRLPTTSFAWLAPIERLVLHAARVIQPIAALTPTNAARERSRLIQELVAGRTATPEWTYARGGHNELDRDLRSALEAAERALDRSAPTGVAALYLERVRELLLEAALCAAAGTAAVGRLAQERYNPSLSRGQDSTSSSMVSQEQASAPQCGDSVTKAARLLCAGWLSEPMANVSGPPICSDSGDPRSLLSRMRAAVGRLRLPFQIVTTPALAPLAATGESAIYVATGRALSDEDAQRTVLHEIEGHARPRARAEATSCVLFRAGTARGTDDQEGRALLLEERAGLLGSRRRRQLAARHRAVDAMIDGASFAEVTRELVRCHGLQEGDAVVAAERAFRGADGEHPGLGRERVYLEAMVRVKAHLAERPDDERVLASGQVSVESIEALRPFAA